MVLDGVTVITGTGNGFTETKMFCELEQPVDVLVAVTVYVVLVVGFTVILELVTPTLLEPVDQV